MTIKSSRVTAHLRLGTSFQGNAQSSKWFHPDRRDLSKELDARMRAKWAHALQKDF
jgi:hypothetical protein